MTILNGRGKYNGPPSAICRSLRASVREPGEKIPGSDIIRKKVLSPLIESGQLIWVYGPEKSGKSWLARSMAHVISYGGTFLEKYEAATGLRVLYIDSEMEPDKLEAAADKELKGLSFTDGVKFARKVARARDIPGGATCGCKHYTEP